MSPFCSSFLRFRPWGRPCEGAGAAELWSLWSVELRVPVWCVACGNGAECGAGGARIHGRSLAVGGLVSFASVAPGEDGQSRALGLADRWWSLPCVRALWFWGCLRSNQVTP